MPTRNPEAGPVTYLLLGEEGNRRTQAGPARSASFFRVSLLHSAANVCTLEVVMLAGLPARDQDVLEFARALPTGGLVDVLEKLENGTASRRTSSRREGLV